jgi:PKHD-type hydroxylase
VLLHIPEVLSREQVMQFRRELEGADWVDGRATVGPQGAQVKQNRQLPELSPVGQPLGRAILEALGRNPLFVSAVLPLRTSAPLFNRYEGGEHYGLHIDGAMRAIAGSDLILRTDVSSTLFLTDPDDYEGGELVVVDTYGTHEVKLPAGDLILYPATSLHRVDPVTRGVRTCSFFWTQSMVSDDGRRTMLFELDQNIQKLRTRIGDCQEVVALTGHYHNLVRQWADIG